MSKKKNQHFVPQFYLRSFSNDPNKKNISVYDPRNDVHIKSAPIRHQASKDYFYGQDGKLDDVLTFFENKVLPIYRKVHDENFVTKPHSEEQFYLLLFAISTELRNPVHIDLLEDSFKNLSDHLNSKGENDIDLSIPNAAFFSLKGLMSSSEICMDLRCKLLINETRYPFLTSDNPLVKYNRFLEYHDSYGGREGYGLKGLKIIIPISPTKSVIFYDEQVYYVGKKKKKTVSVTEDDVFKLNLMQFLNSKKVVFHNGINEDYLKHLRDQYNSYETKVESKLEEFDTEDELKKLVLTYKSGLRLDLKLSFLFLSNHAVQYKLGDRAVHPRKHAVIIRKLREQERDKSE